MFIVNKLLHRALHTSQKPLVVGVLSTASRVLGSDFVGVIQRRMRDECYPRPPPQTQTIIVGNPAATLAQSMAYVVDDRSVAFMVLVNNLDVAAEYCRRIVNSYINAALPSPDNPNPQPEPAYGDDSAPPTPLDILFPFPPDLPAVLAALTTLDTAFAQKATEVLSDAITTLFNQLIKAKLRPLITEAFRDVDYSTTTPSGDPAPTDSSSSDADPPDLEIVKARFEHPFLALIHPFKYTLTDAPFTRLLTLTANYLSRLLEKKLIQLGSPNGPPPPSDPSGGGGGQISELGAIRLERDVAGLVGVVVKAGRYGVREAFGRCVQICLVLNVDEEEVGGVFDDGDGGDGEGGDTGMGVEWKLSVEERRRVRGMLQRR